MSERSLTDSHGQMGMLLTLSAVRARTHSFHSQADDIGLVCHHQRFQPSWNADALVAALQFLAGVNRDETCALLTCTLFHTRCAIDVDVAVADVRQHTERASAYLAGLTPEHLLRTRLGHLWPIAAAGRKAGGQAFLWVIYVQYSNSART